MRKKLLGLLFLNVSSTFCYNTCFQEILLRYLKQQKEECRRELSSHSPDLSGNVVAFVVNLNKNNRIEENGVIQILKAEKFVYLDKLIKKFEQCILCNRHRGPIYDRIVVVRAKYTNEQYVQSWNKMHPEEIKIPQSKLVYSSIYGLAISKDTLSKFEFFVNLKNIDIPVLLNIVKDKDVILKQRKYESGRIEGLNGKVYLDLEEIMEIYYSNKNEYPGKFICSIIYNYNRVDIEE